MFAARMRQTARKMRALPKTSLSKITGGMGVAGLGL
jgi:hypothetical protein